MKVKWEFLGGKQREKLTFVNPAGKGGRILNAVGRLSNLNLLTIKGDPTGANGRTGCCFELIDSGRTTVVLVLGLWETGFSPDLFFSGVLPAFGDITTGEASEELGVEALATSTAIPTLVLLAGCSVSDSPLLPVVCKTSKSKTHNETFTRLVMRM